MKCIKHGMTLIEVLVGIAILGGSGSLLLGFLYRNPMSHKAYVESYGTLLSRTQLYKTWAARSARDTLLEHRDSLGVPWTTRLQITPDGDERCVAATSVRNKKDTTRTLHFCLYE